MKTAVYGEAVQTKIFTFGAFEPVEGAEFVRAQIREAHQFRNKLVENKRATVTEYGEILAREEPDVRRLQAKIARQTKLIRLANQKIQRIQIKPRMGKEPPEGLPRHQRKNHPEAVKLQAKIDKAKECRAILRDQVRTLAKAWAERVTQPLDLKFREAFAEACLREVAFGVTKTRAGYKDQTAARNILANEWPDRANLPLKKKTDKKSKKGKKIAEEEKEEETYSEFLSRCINTLGPNPQGKLRATLMRKWLDDPNVPQVWRDKARLDFQKTERPKELYAESSLSPGTRAVVVEAYEASLRKTAWPKFVDKSQEVRVGRQLGPQSVSSLFVSDDSEEAQEACPIRIRELGVIGRNRKISGLRLKESPKEKKKERPVRKLVEIDFLADKSNRIRIQAIFHRDLPGNGKVTHLHVKVSRVGLRPRYEVQFTVTYPVGIKTASTVNLTLSGEQVVGDVACVEGDRVLAAGQTDPKKNGVWIVKVGPWVRATDHDSNRGAPGARVEILDGANKGVWLRKPPTTGTVIPDVTAQTWAKADCHLAINLGWRRLEDQGVRVATTWDGKKATRIDLDPTYFSGLDKKKNILEAKDERFNEAKAFVASFLREREIKYEDFSRYLREAGVQFPEWADPTNLPAWRKPGRLATLTRAMLQAWTPPENVSGLWKAWLRECGVESRKKRTNPQPKKDLLPELSEVSAWLAGQGVEDVYLRLALTLEWWRRKDEHLIAYGRNLEKRLVLARREVYRVAASNWSRQYGRVTVEDWDKSVTARRNKNNPTVPTQQDDASSALRQQVGISLLTMALSEKFGAHFSKAPAQNITIEHFGCGGVGIGVRDAINVRCSKCGRNYDQDVNAAMHLFERSSDATTPGSARSSEMPDAAE